MEKNSCLAEILPHRQAFAFAAGGAEEEHVHVAAFGIEFADDAEFVAAHPLFQGF